MTEVAEYTPAAVEEQPRNVIAFSGTHRSMAVGIAMFAAAVLAFSMDLTHVFFARAVAWTFVFWGALLIYGSLIDVYQSYEITDDTLIIRNPVRFLLPTKQWAWANIQRLDVVVRRPDAEYEDATLKIYYQEPGELNIEREDRVYHPELARLIIERAGLQPVEKTNPQDFAHLPQGKGAYIWNKTGRMAS
ncbi:MAG: hypothetical protein R3C14_07085 [Caldilineaceae bacterium]